MTDALIYPWPGTVRGALVESGMYARPAGGRCGCNPSYGQSCTWCADPYGAGPAGDLPPCMRPGWTYEKGRARERRMAAARGHQWAIDELAQTTTTTTETEGGTAA